MKTNGLSISGRIVVSGLLIFMVMLIFSSCDNKSTNKKRQAASTSAPDKCIHDASVKVCFICDASLRDPKRLWCKEHSAYEDRCFKCHPEAQDKSRLYCNEHALYEDECFLCHPELLQAAPQTQNSQPSNSTAQCKEHGVAEIDCGICHPELLSQKQVGEGLKIRFESLQSADKAGVVVAQPEISANEGGDLYPARTSFNENEASVVAARFSGTLTSVKVDLGANVKKGQIIATIASPEYAALVAEYRSADQDARVKETEYQREMELFKRNATSRQDRDNASVVYTRAQNQVDALRQKLINAGLSEEQTSALLTDHSVNSEFPVRSSVSGTVTQRMASTGLAVSPESPIVAIVNLAKLWVFVSVPSSIGLQLQVGDILQIRFEQGITEKASINWISPSIDQSSGMIEIRAEMPNPKQTLKSGMFGKALITHTSPKQTLVIPSDALAEIDGTKVIFTKEAPDLYSVKKVVLNGITSQKASIADGLSEQDNVVVSGTFVVKSEFLKSRLGAGCVDH